jgi:uncharacterized membrane protein YbaN (DUF454 family)
VKHEENFWMLKRACYFGLGICLLMLGLVGLVVPILPGILFLALAAVSFSAMSPKFQNRLQRHPTWRGWQRRWAGSRGLPLFHRFRLAFWLTAEATLNMLRKDR